MWFIILPFQYMQQSRFNTTMFKQHIIFVWQADLHVSNDSPQGSPLSLVCVVNNFINKFETRTKQNQFCGLGMYCVSYFSGYYKMMHLFFFHFIITKTFNFPYITITSKEGVNRMDMPRLIDIATWFQWRFQLIEALEL